MRTGKPLLIVLGALLALFGMGLLAAGVALSWVHATQRDADGFYTSPTYDLSSDGYAITTEELHVVARPGDWFPAPGELTFRVRVTPTDPAQEVFVGIADGAEAAAFLDGVAHDQVTRIGGPSDTVRYRTEPGTSTPALPGSQDLWVASSEGTGTQVVDVDAEPGEWTLVVMQADGTSGIEVAATAGVRSDLLLPIAIGVLIAALFLLGGAAALLIAGAATRSDVEVAPAAWQAGVVTGPYPVVIEGRLDPELSRGMWLVKWLLAVPHLIVLAFLWTAFVVLTVVAGFAILFTGRYPRSIFDFNVGVLRWTWRVTYYAFGVLGTDRYPPFSLANDPDYPARLDVAYPERLSRGLVVVKWWLLAIPHYLVVAILTGGIVSWTFDVGGPDGWQAVASAGLIGVLVLAAAIALLFSGRYPQGLYDLVMGLQRWVYRVTAYAALMTDTYPPFRLDAGGTEPGSPPSGPPDDPTPSGDEQRELTHA
jgi:hypothetical protein